MPERNRIDEMGVTLKRLAAAIVQLTERIEKLEAAQSKRPQSKTARPTRTTKENSV